LPQRIIGLDAVQISRRLVEVGAEGDAEMIDKNPGPAVTAMQRQLMQYLRAGEWKIVTKIPVSASLRTLDRISSNGWIERRGFGPRSEIKLTPAGLAALQAPI
jgi:hypothetical protein